MMAEHKAEMGQMLGRLKDKWVVIPAVIVFPALMILAGLAAAVLGSDASKAFTNIGGDVTIRVMGVALVIGGFSTLWGVARPDSFWELVGLTLICGGSTVYAFGVVLGLGKGGVIAGLGFLAIALWALSRVMVVMRAAKTVKKRSG